MSELRTTPCRKCEEPMIFARLNGRPHPFDAEPDSIGEYQLTNGEAVYIPRDARVSRTDLHVSHFKTCPDADYFKKKKRG